MVLYIDVVYFVVQRTYLALVVVRLNQRVMILSVNGLKIYFLNRVFFLKKYSARNPACNFRSFPTCAPMVVRLKLQEITKSSGRANTVLIACILDFEMSPQIHVYA